MKAYSDLHITLNFLAIGQQDFHFIIYAKSFEDSKEMNNAKDDDVRIYQNTVNLVKFLEISIFLDTGYLAHYKSYSVLKEFGRQGKSIWFHRTGGS
jgi:hypothetical protein